MSIFETEKSLMSKVTAGDPHACRRFVDKYMPMVYRVSVRMLSDTALAEDISQDIFVKIWRYSNTFNGKSKLQTWIYRIVINTCLDALKKQKTYIDIEDVEISDSADLTDVTYLKKQTAQQIQYALTCLKPQERSAIVLFYWEEYKIKQIAEILGIGHKATESLLRRTRSKLLYLLKETV